MTVLFRGLGKTISLIPKGMQLQLLHRRNYRVAHFSQSVGFNEKKSDTRRIEKKSHSRDRESAFRFNDGIISRGRGKTRDLFCRMVLKITKIHVTYLH